MIITRIAKHKNKRRKYVVHIDGAAAFDVGDGVLLKHGLRVNDALDEDRIAAIKAAELENEAQMLALNYISYRPRSSREVFQHLLRKRFSKELAEAVVSHFQSVSLINNFEFARMYVRDKIRRKPTGTALLHKLLAAKGIPSPIIDQVLSEIISEEDQKEAARELASKRMRLTRQSTGKLDLMKQKQRLTGYLLRHGFSSEIVQKTIQHLFRS